MGLKFKTLLIFLLTFLRYIFFGRASHKKEIYRKIVIFQGGKMGDMICTTSMFRAIKKKYPDCKIVVVGNSVNQTILEYNHDVDTYIVHEGQNFFDTITKIKKEKADFGCITAPSPIGLSILYLAGIPLIATPVIVNGWSPFQTKTYKILCNFVIKKEYVKGQYTPRQYLKLLEPIDICTDDTKKYIFWSTQAEVRMNEFISNIHRKYSLYVGIMPGAGNKVKQWPTERFASIADYLITTYGAYIFVIGNESNRKEIDSMFTFVQNKECITNCNGLSLDETKALIAKMSMTVSVDTGPIFIAEACGVPTVDIGGVIHPNDMAPNDGNLHLLITYDGDPLLWSMNSRVYDYKKAREGIESITIPMVRKRVDELVARICGQRRVKGIDRWDEMTQDCLGVVT